MISVNQHIAETVIIAPLDFRVGFDCIRGQTFDCFTNDHEGKYYPILQQSVGQECFAAVCSTRLNMQDSL